MLELKAIEVDQGEFQLRAAWVLPKGITAVLGPSGAGKSTLLAVIAGFLQPSRGTVQWEGTNITALAPGDRPCSIIFQDNNLFPHLTLFQNVGLGVRPDLRLSDTQRDMVAQALIDVGLKGFSGRKPGTLSGGQQSRAAIARVLVANRPLVLLDEPFAALGPGLKQEILGLVKRVLADKDILIVTHDPADAKAIADHVILVNDGVASLPQQTAALFADPPPELSSYLGL